MPKVRKMRTTIRIDDELYRMVKARAARAGRTVAEVIEEALRAAMAERRPGARPDLPPLPTSGGGGTLPGVDLTSAASLLDTLDEDVALVARR